MGEIMFEKLVVSSAQKRKGRTTRFFVCTSIVYLSTIALVFAVSVLLADPKLADTSDTIIHIAQLPPAPRGPQVIVDRAYPGGTPRQDLTNVLKYDDIANRQHSGPPRLPLPAGSGVRSDEGVAGGVPDGVPGVIGVPGSTSRGTDPPPRPVDPPKPQPAPATEKRPLPVTSSVLQGKAIERSKPVYPPLAKQIHLQGDVSVEVMISPEGRVESARVVSGHPMLAERAREAAMSWRFQPTFLNGVPVRVTGVIVFVFKLGE
jgi:TonB family protein